MRMVILLGLLVGLMSVTGCGSSASSELLPVTGTVTLNNEPIEHAVLKFTPDGDTKGNGGSARTDAAGKSEAVTPQGKKGLHPGKYKVVISRMLHADGSAIRPDEQPIETQARETLPAIYSSPEKSTLTAEVAPDKPVNFTLTVKKK